MSSLHFESTYDDKKLQDGLSRSNQSVSEWARNAQKEGLIVERSFKQVQQAAAAYVSFRFAKQVGQDIIAVRGEFQQLNIALETMLGNKAKADQMMDDIITMGMKTPFTVRDVSANVKQLMAMGVEADNVLNTMKSLGDVAAGVSVPISRLAINYGQVATLGKLQQREIRDFAMAGVPLIEELAKNMGKTKQEITDMVSESKIGFKDVEHAFQTMSGEGGKFFNLMEKQNASVTGQISNLRDKIDLMLNDIGKSNEGVIYGGIEGLGNLVTHYEDVLKILKVLTITYGSYKAAAIAVTAYEAALAKNEGLRAKIIEAKVKAIEKEIAAQEAATASAAKQAAIEEAAAAKQVTTENLKQAAMAKTAAAKEVLAAANKDLVASEEVYNAMLQKSFVAATTSKEGIAARTLVEKNRAKVVKANAAVEKAVSQEIIVNSRIEAQAVAESEAEKVAAKQAGIATDREKLIASQTATAAEVRAAKAQRILNKTMLGNPYVVALLGITALTGALIYFTTRTGEAEKALREFTKESAKEKDKVDDMFAALKAATEGTDKYKEAKKNLVDTYGQYIPEQLKELENLKDIETAQQNVNDKIRENIALKQRNQAGDNIREQYADEISKRQVQIFSEIKDKFGADIAAQARVDLEDIIARAQKESIDVTKEREAFMKKFNLMNDKGVSQGGTGRTVAGAFYYLLTDVQSERKQLESVNKEFDDYIKVLDSRKDTTTIPKSQIQKTIAQQIDETSKAIAEAKKTLTEYRAAESTKTVDDIKEQEAALKDLQDRLEVLTGISKKEAGKGHYESLLSSIKEVNNLILNGTKEQLPELQKKLKALVDEKEAWEEIIKASRGQTVAPKIIKSKKGSIQINADDYKAQKLEVEKILAGSRKITAEERKRLEYQARLLSDLAAQSDKLSEIAESLNDVSKLTDSIENMFGKLDGEVSSVMRGITEISSGATSFFSNLSTGNYFGAFSSSIDILSGVITLFSSDDTALAKSINNYTDKLNQSISATNDLIEYQLELLSQQTGQTYIHDAAIQTARLNNELLQTKNQLQQIHVYSKRSGHELIDTTKWDYEQWLKAVESGAFSFDGMDEIIQELLSQWSYLDNTLSDLGEQMNSKILAFTKEDVASSLADGIIDGLKLGENGLGDFAETFGELMKKYARQALETFINENYLQQWYQQAYNLANDEDGLTEEDTDFLKKEYINMVKGGDEFWKNISEIVDLNTTSQTGLTGAISNISEETAGLIAGQFTAMRVDLKAIDENTNSTNDYLMQSVAIQHQIAENTTFNKHLKPIYDEIHKMNQTLDKKL